VNEHDVLEIQHQGRSVRLFIALGIPESTPFAPQARNEISEIGWHYISNLNDTHKGDFFLVSPFILMLRKWLKSPRGKARRLKFGGGSGKCVSALFFSGGALGSRWPFLTYFATEFSAAFLLSKCSVSLSWSSSCQLCFRIFLWPHLLKRQQPVFDRPT